MTRGYPDVRHAVEAFDKKTEFLVFEVPIPRENIEQLRIIMKWSEPEDEIYGYDLDSAQITQLEALIGITFYDPKYDFQIGSHASK
jgi:hypothetical protein